MKTELSCAAERMRGGTPSGAEGRRGKEALARRNSSAPRKSGTTNGTQRRRRLGDSRLPDCSPLSRVGAEQGTRVVGDRTRSILLADDTHRGRARGPPVCERAVTAKGPIADGPPRRVSLLAFQGQGGVPQRAADLLCSDRKGEPSGDIERNAIVRQAQGPQGDDAKRFDQSASALGRQHCDRRWGAGKPLRGGRKLHQRAGGWSHPDSRGLFASGPQGHELEHTPRQFTKPCRTEDKPGVRPRRTSGPPTRSQGLPKPLETGTPCDTCARRDGQAKTLTACAIRL